MRDTFNYSITIHYGIIKEKNLMIKSHILYDSLIKKIQSICESELTAVPQHAKSTRMVLVVQFRHRQNYSSDLPKYFQEKCTGEWYDLLIERIPRRLRSLRCNAANRGKMTIIRVRQECLTYREVGRTFLSVNKLMIPRPLGRGSSFRVCGGIRDRTLCIIHSII